MSVMTGGEALMQVLQMEGVEYVFGMPGATEVSFMDVLERQSSIKYILGLHEIVCLGMAEGYSRTSGKTGMVNLHTAPGLAASLPMLHNAYYGKVPLVVTAGQQDTRLLMCEPALSGDLVGLASSFTKWSTEIHYAEDIPMAMQRAFKIATQPPKGPVFVSLPQNILGQSIDFNYTTGTPVFTKMGPDDEAVHKAADLISEAKSPALIVESGVSRDEAHIEVVKLAEIIGAPVYQTWMSDMNFPTNHPQYLGDLDLASPKAKEILQSVDVLVVIGAPLFMQPIYFPEPLIAPDTKIVQIDDDPWEIGKNFPVSAPIQGNIKIAVSELNRVLEERMTESTVKRASARAEAVHSQKEQMTRDFLQRAKQESEFVPISISRLMQELRDAIKPGTMIVDDCWSSSGFLRRTIDFTEPGSFQRARSGGSIGWGMSGCLGVKLAASDKPVVAVVGDGSAIWSIQSLWTASHYHIPVTYIICANASYCQVRLMKSIIMGDKGDCLGTMLEQPRIDFTQLSRAMGVPAQRVERPEDLKAALNNALDSKQTNLIEVYVESKA